MAGSSAAELQKVFWETLSGDPAIAALVAGVYDRPPSDPFGDRSAYITLGDVTTAEDDADGISGLVATTTISVWSRAVGSVEAKTIVDLVRKKLHRASPSLAANALVEVWVEQTATNTESDGLTTRGTVRVRAMIEEPLNG